MSKKSSADEPVPGRPGAPPSDEDAARDRVDGEAVVVPGQRPGPTEPTPF